MNSPVTPRIVITGAPASGKSRFLERLADEPVCYGYILLEEAARLLLSTQPHLREDWAEFHRRVFGLQTAREGAVKGKPMITDRGTVDAFAFHPETLNDVGTTLEREYARYSTVIQLGSAAALADRPWQTDDIRSENRDEALRIEQAITNVWQGHPDFHFIAASTDIDEKYRQFLAVLRQCIRIETGEDSA